MFSIFGFQSFLFPFEFKMPQRRYFWYLSCLLFSELPRSMVKCLYLILKNSQSFFLQILACIFLLLIEAYLHLVQSAFMHITGIMVFTYWGEQVYQYHFPNALFVSRFGNCHSILVIVILANMPTWDEIFDVSTTVVLEAPSSSVWDVKLGKICVSCLGLLPGVTWSFLSSVPLFHEEKRSVIWIINNPAMGSKCKSVKKAPHFPPSKSKFKND